MKGFFEYIYNNLNLSLDAFDYLFFVAIIGLSLIIYNRMHSLLLGVLFLIAISILGIKLLENSVFLVISLFLSLLALSIYYTHSLWLFSIIYALTSYAYWYYFGKDPDLGSIKAVYSLKNDIDPLTASFLLKEKVDAFDIVACIYNLVRKDCIEVEMQKDDIYLKKRVSDRFLTKPEMFLLDRVFMMTGVEIGEMGINIKEDEFPQVVSLGHVLEKISEWYPALSRSLEEHVVDSGFYDYAPVLQRKYTKYLAGILLMVFVWIASFPLPLFHFFGTSNLIFNIIIPGIIPSLSTYILSLYVTKRTEKGMEAYRDVLGFREFLRRVESPRLVYLIKEKRVDIEELFVYMTSLKVVGFLDKLKISLLDFEKLNGKIQTYLKLDAFVKENIKRAFEKKIRENQYRKVRWRFTW